MLDALVTNPHLFPGKVVLSHNQTCFSQKNENEEYNLYDSSTCVPMFIHTQYDSLLSVKWPYRVEDTCPTE